MERLASLSPEQQQGLEAYRDRWEQLAVSVSPTDEATAEAALARVYEDAGLPTPEISWFGCPGEAIQAFVAGGKTDGANVWHSIGGLLGDRIWRTLWQQIETEIGTSVWEKLRGTLWQRTSSDWDAGRSVLAVLEDGDRTEVFGLAAEFRREGRTAEFWFEEDWVSELLPTYAFFDEVLGVEGLEEVGPFVQLAAAAGPWLARERRVYVSERPTHFGIDERGRFHSEDGPALAYPTGPNLWCWHGVTVPEQVIMSPNELTTPQIGATRNAEVRRVMIERFGIERFLSSGKGTLEHQDRYGRLWQVNDWRDLWIELRNSTPEPDGTHKTYFLRVPPWMRTAHEAVAWTFDMSTDEYRLAAES